MKAALWNRLGAPLETLAAFEHTCEQRMLFHSLNQIVHIQVARAIIETDHQTERHHVIGEWIKEAAAKGIFGKRPSESVNDFRAALSSRARLLSRREQKFAAPSGGEFPAFSACTPAQRVPRVPSESATTCAEICVAGIKIAAGLTIALETGRRGLHTDDAILLHHQRFDREAR